MVNLLPAILIGGPPNAGKSVLFYSLTKTLHEQGISHHAIRACPDGEGNWFQEIHQEVGPDNIRLIYFAEKTWTDAFVKGICSDLERRHLPLLVDMGGRPRDWQNCILLRCTHSLLLLRSDDEESARFWRHLVASNGLLPLAQIYSEQHGSSKITVDVPVIQGTITELNRGTLAYGPVFEALVERIAALFSSYSLPELERAKLAMAPADWVVNLDSLLERLDPLAKEWKPEMLRQLATELPTHTSLAIYGRGPGWLYGALAAQAERQLFYQFDPRIGWLSPPSLQISSQPPPEGIVVQLREHQSKDALILSVRIANEYLDYLQAEQLPFPTVPTEHGLILDGKIPHWLLTALVRLYHSAGVAWIACNQPQLKSAVVVASRVKAHTIGEVIPMPIP